MIIYIALSNFLTGKAGVNVIIVDGDYERSSSSVEDEAMPTAAPSVVEQVPIKEVAETSLIPTSRPVSPDEPTEPSTLIKTDISIIDNKDKSEMWVKIDLHRLNLNHIPILRKHIEDVKPWLIECKPDVSKKEEKHSDCEETKAKPPVKDNSESKKPLLDDPPDHKHKSKKRKRRNSSSSRSSHSTVSSSLSHSSKKLDYHKKEKNKEKEHVKHKRRKEENEHVQRSHIENLNLINAPPTNHEREATRIPVVSNCDPSPSTSRSLSSREYHSYFDVADEPSEYEER